MIDQNSDCIDWEGLGLAGVHQFTKNPRDQVGCSLDEIVTVSVHKYNVIMSCLNLAFWSHLIQETLCQTMDPSPILQDMCLFAHYLWTAPISVALSLYFLWQKLGVVAFAGLAYLLLIVPFNSIYIGKQMRKYQVRTSQLLDYIVWSTIFYFI